ncbi:hypothetical protein [Deinococcus fonticola]|uniref:hypothetical protein n=1 Tax=Deinococcus fonticola TaxID=2528713 RepID=UPI0010753E0A|nr:hypothetical protein [Deinococcus fonticola]
MKHYVFPTVSDADAFIADLKAQNVVGDVSGQTSYHRRTELQTTPTTTTTATTTEQAVVAEAGGDGKDVAAGAVTGGALGTAAGLAAGALVAATGGLAAIPVVLGLGIGAAAGAATGAVSGHGLDDDAAAEVAGGTRRYQDSYTLENDEYDRLHGAVSNDGRLVAVEDNIPADIVAATAARHNGRQA